MNNQVFIQPIVTESQTLGTAAIFYLNLPSVDGIFFKQNGNFKLQICIKIGRSFEYMLICCLPIQPTENDSVWLVISNWWLVYQWNQRRRSAQTVWLPHLSSLKAENEKKPQSMLYYRFSLVIYLCQHFRFSRIKF